MHVVLVVEANKRYQLSRFASNLVHFSIQPKSIAAGKRASVRLYTTLYSEQADSESDENPFAGTIAMLGTSADALAPTELSENYFGSWLEHGAYIECLDDDNGASQIIVNLVVVKREEFSPAYLSILDVNQYYWNCWRPGYDFLDEFDLGQDSDVWYASDDEDPELSGEGTGKPSDTFWWQDDVFSKDGVPPHPEHDALEAETSGGDGEGGNVSWTQIDTETNRPINLYLNENVQPDD